MIEYSNILTHVLGYTVQENFHLMSHLLMNIHSADCATFPGCSYLTKRDIMAVIFYLISIWLHCLQEHPVKNVLPFFFFPLIGFPNESLCKTLRGQTLLEGRLPRPN